MSQSVARLKELLFDSEAQALVDLSRKIDEVAKTDVAGREDIKQQIKKELSGVIERAGTAERFTESVSEVINEALQRAEVHKHDELSTTIAPLVVTTIKTELRNSQDEMVEALYPITGRLVKAYVASAIKDLTEQMNRRLEQNAFMLRLQSLTTGRSVAELALAGTQDFEIEELFLIRRGSGELIAHWPQLADARREQMLSGVLAAVNAVANEAFAADESSLRQIELNETTVYLRGSPLYLLAAKCSGTAPRGAEQMLDEAFLNTVEKQHDAESLPMAERQGWHQRLLGDLGEDLKAKVAEQKSDIARPNGNPLKTLAAIILLPLAAFAAWAWAADFANNRARSTGERVIAETDAMQGYPARIKADNFGRTITVSGLTPSADAKEKILNRLTLVLPKAAINDELTVVAGSGIVIPDQTPAIDALRESVRGVESNTLLGVLRRSSERTVRLLTGAEADLRAAALDERAANIGVIAKEVASAAAALPAGTSQGADSKKFAQQFTAFSSRILMETNAVLTALDQPTARQKRDASSLDETAPDIAVEAMAGAAERIAGVAEGAALAARIKPVPTEPSPRDKLKDLAARSAVFFTNGIDYRNPEIASKTLDMLAAHVKAAQSVLRIVGYTDLAGTTTGNSTLAAERAEKVRQDLVRRGAPASLMTPVGRAEAKDLSMNQGPESPNRRVEFEVGFDGEVQ